MANDDIDDILNEAKDKFNNRDSITRGQKRIGQTLSEFRDEFYPEFERFGFTLPEAFLAAYLHDLYYTLTEADE